MIIKEWNEADRPREKLFLKGRLNLSDAELLSILIGTGHKNSSALDISRQVLFQMQHEISNLSKMNMPDLIKFKGIGKAKAAIIVAAMELGRRQKKRNDTGKIKLNSSKLVFDMMQPIIGDLDHEEFWVLLLNNANKLYHQWKLSKGGITATLVDVRLIYEKALAYKSTSIILCHNHPSGNLKPSQSDILLTQKVIKAGAILDIKVLDHVIISELGYYSFTDHGKI